MEPWMRVQQVMFHNRAVRCVGELYFLRAAVSTAVLIALTVYAEPANITG
jgi:hypothetical protein